MTRAQRFAAACGMGGLLVACGDPSAPAPTQPEGSLQTAVASAAAVGASAFNGTWRTLPSLRPARWRSAADVLGKSVIVVGGLSTDGPSRRVDAYNLETQAWTELKPLPVPLYDAIGATAIKGKLYVAGGRSSEDGGCAKTLFVYDPATNSWTRKADMPSRGCHGVQDNVLGLLYVYSLYTGIPEQPTLFASYNPTSGKWVRRPAPPRVYQSWPTGGAVNEKFYLTGGVDMSGQVNRELQAYDPATRTWATKSPMPTGRDGAFAAVFHGKLFVAGGVTPRDVWELTDVVEAYEPLTDTWATGPSMLAPRGFGSSAWAGGRFFTIDGTDGPLSSRVEALSTSY